MKIKILASLSLLALAGCQSNDYAVSCSSQTDWESVGLETAQNGKNVRSFETYKSSCGEQLPENAKSLYLDGYTVGIKDYCSYENGFKVGEKGLENPNVCPFEIRAEFDKGHKLGMLDRREKQKNVELAERERDRALQSSGSAMSSMGGN